MEETSQSGCLRQKNNLAAQERAKNEHIGRKSPETGTHPLGGDNGNKRMYSLARSAKDESEPELEGGNLLIGTENHPALPFFSSGPTDRWSAPFR